jgi:hypothetical protein
MNGQTIIRTGDKVKSLVDNKIYTVIHLVKNGGLLSLYESASNIYELHLDNGLILKIHQVELLK